MPFTPFHFGPGAAIHALAPRKISFLAFCAANVLIDVEPLYYLLTHQYPLHRFFHTYVGATLIALATALLFLGALWLYRKLGLPDPFRLQGLKALPVWLGAAAGSYSHVLLDSVMHPDIVPLAPFSTANALYEIIPVDLLHVACIALAIAGVLLLEWRRERRSSSRDYAD